MRRILRKIAENDTGAGRHLDARRPGVVDSLVSDGERRSVLNRGARAPSPLAYRRIRYLRQSEDPILRRAGQGGLRPKRNGYRCFACSSSSGC
jgi:hypothetical protein